MARSFDISVQSQTTVAPSTPVAAAISRGGSVPSASSTTEVGDDRSVGMVIVNGSHDGISASYDESTRTVDLTNTNKGTVAVAAHTLAADPHGDRAYSDAQLTAHGAALDPHAQYVKVSDISELIDDRVGALLVAGANVSLVYNDVANTLTITAAGGSGGGGTSDHGALMGLGDDDHTQYVLATGARPMAALTVTGGATAASFTGPLTGNASTATALQTARTIALSGGVTGTATAFDGTAGIIIPVTAVDATALTGTVDPARLSGTYGISITGAAGTVAALQTPRSFSVTGGATAAPVAFDGTAPVALSVTALDASYLTGTVAAGRLSGSYAIDVTGNAATAAKLVTPRTINGVAFDGTANISIPATLAGTVTAGSYLTGGTFDGTTSKTFAVDADTANTPSKVVARDASGNFSAGTVTAALSGNATTASTLQTARTIALSGGVTGTATSFNGSTNITIPVTAVSAGSLTGTVAAARLTGTYAISVSGNAATATQLATPRTINGVAFDGTANITIPSSSAAALTAGSYLSGSAYDGTTARTWDVLASPFSLSNYVVARDSLGDFTARIITASLSGNASTATKLATARSIDGVLFDGTADIIFPHGALNVGPYMAYSGGASAYDGTAPRLLALNASSGSFANYLVARDASGNFDAGTIYAALVGNASTATALQTARSINGVSFNGTADITVADATKLPLTGGTLTGALVGTTFRNSPTGQGTMGIKVGAGSGATVNAAVDDFVIDADTAAGISILSTATGTGYFVFGSTVANDRCTLQYDHSTDTLRGRVGGVANVFTATATGMAVMDASTVGGIKMGYRGKPRLTSTTVNAASSGKTHATSGTTVTIPASTMAAGDEITIVNNAATGVVNIGQGSGLTMWWCGMNVSGSRTLGVRGMCTIWFDSPTVCYIRGDGLT